MPGQARKGNMTTLPRHWVKRTLGLLLASAAIGLLAIAPVRADDWKHGHYRYGYGYGYGRPYYGYYYGPRVYYAPPPLIYYPPPPPPAYYAPPPAYYYPPAPAYFGGPSIGFQFSF